MAHAKAVFLVNDEEPQVFEMGVRAEQFVRAHHNVHRAVGNAFKGGVDFFGGPKAAHFSHLDWPFAEPVHQRLVMLLGQQSGGC